MSLLALFPLLCPGAALAQGFDAQRYTPPAGEAGGLLVERASVPAHLGWSVGAMASYADDPVVLSDPSTGEVLERPVDALVGLDLAGSIGLFGRLELALDVPLVPVDTGDALDTGGQALSAGPGLGDVRFVPKGVLVRTPGDTHFTLGAGLPITLPTGDPDELRGAGEVTVTPELLAGLYGPRVAVHGDVGFRARPGVVATDPIGNEVVFGGAVAWTILETADDPLDLLVEAQASADVTRPGPNLTDLPLEVLGGLAWRPGGGWTFTGGAGPGLTDGLGTPDFRVAGGARYSPEPAPKKEPPPAVLAPKDTDGDGIVDTKDACPTEKEDKDGFQDADGCPDLDNDQDHVPDDQDECPQVPEGAGGDGDGCPDQAKVHVEQRKIEVDGKVLFASGSAEIDPRSFPLLDELAAVLQDHPAIRHLQIQGHTDNVGDAGYNEALSQRRADSVKRALVERGVDGARLTPLGFGESVPIAPNDTPAGRASNRRVEFVVTQE